MPVRKTYDPDSYPSSAFDDDFCLRPPFLLWVVVLYLSRAVLLPIVMGVGHYAGVNADAMRMMRVFWGAETLLTALFAVPVLYALLRRSPSAPRFLRWIWSRGRAFLCISIVIDIVLNARQFISWDEIHDEQVLAVGGTVVDLYFLVYVLAARRVRDSFADFPS